MNLNSKIKVFQELLEYIEKNHVFDKISDSGCGHIDPHRSDAFQSLIDKAKENLKELLTHLK